MALDTFMVIAASYDDTDAALADYDVVHDMYYERHMVDTYDAAVFTRENDKVKIVKKHEQPTRQGAWGGLGIGLVGGALVALFPAIGIGAGLLVGGAGGALVACTQRNRGQLSSMRSGCHQSKSKQISARASHSRHRCSSSVLSSGLVPP
jgi:uncharacterized membrane protein